VTGEGSIGRRDAGGMARMRAVSLDEAPLGKIGVFAELPARGGAG